MKTEFILGDAAQDFGKQVAERTAEFIKDDPLNSVLIITPPQATSSAEQMILKELGKITGANGVMGVDISTLSRTAQQILAEVGADVKKTLSPAGKSMAVKEILNENAESIKSLTAKKSSRDLPNMIVQTIRDLKNQNVTPEMLKSVETKSERTKDKLDDLALIFDSYNEKTDEYSDQEDRLLKASKLVSKSEFIKNTDVIIYGFTSLSRRAADFISSIMRVAKSTAITFLKADKNAPDKAVYDISSRYLKPLKDAAEAGEVIITNLPRSGGVPKKAPEIIYTAKNLFSRKPAKDVPEKKGAVSIGYAKDKKTEVDGVITQIVKLNKEKGIPYNKIALVCGKSSEYLPIIRRRFKAAGVPCFTGDKRSLAQSNIASFVLTAFKLSKGRPSKNLILEHAAAGFTELNDFERYNLENYAFQKIGSKRYTNQEIGSGFAFFKAFDNKLEKARQTLINPIDELRKKTKKAKTVSEWIDCVLNYLKQINIREKIQSKINKMVKQGYLKEADYHEQAYKRIMGVLDEAKEICGNMSAESDFIGVFEAGVESEEISVIPQTNDEVVCGDIYSLNIPEVSALFILGMNMGSIPDYSNEAGVLNEQEREAVFNLGEGFLPANRADIRKLDILRAFARPEDYLYLSYIDDAQSKPSLLADRAIALNSAEPVDLEKIAPLVKNNALEFTAHRLRNVADGIFVGDEKWRDEIEQAVYKEEEFSDFLDSIKSINFQESRNLKLDKELAGELYGDRPLSVTRTQTFYSCPYQYFIKYGLGVEEMQEAEVSPLNKGNYAHKMLDLIAKGVDDKQKQWDEIDEIELNNIIEESRKKTLEETPEYNYSDANAVILDGLSEAVKDAAKKVWLFSKSGALKPYKAEFNCRDDKSTRHLSGKIDRIDVAELDGRNYFGVVDYKSSGEDFDINKFYGGIKVQLIFYLMAVKTLLGEEYVPAGAAFMEIMVDWNNANDKMKGIVFSDKEDIEIAEKSKNTGKRKKTEKSRKLYGEGKYGSLSSITATEYSTVDANNFIKYLNKLVKTADERIADGDIGITPALYLGKKCEYCGYRSVCLKDIDDRTGDRVIEELNKEEVLKRIEEELGE